MCWGRSHYPPAGTKNRRAGGGFVRFPEKLSFPTALGRASPYSHFVLDAGSIVPPNRAAAHP